jgi:Ran GTPase-activating protein (RanGAP) involved in mRNA processing and transport
VNVKQLSISSYSDISKLSSETRTIHFRKFVSRKLLRIILKSCENLEKVSLSKYALQKCNPEIIDYLSKRGVAIQVSDRGIGRPSLLEKIGGVTFRI